MPLSKAHKAQTRQKILNAAGKLFRRRGYDGVGIDEIMAAAGLTRGGFYAHFTSKAELFKDVMASDHGIIRQLRQRKSDAADIEATRAVLGDYLDPAHLTVVRKGCTFAALTADAARSDRATRNAYTGAFADFIGELEKSSGDAHAASLSAVLAVGGVMIAGTLTDSELAARILESCRKTIDDQLSDRSG